MGPNDGARIRRASGRYECPTRRDALARPLRTLFSSKRNGTGNGVEGIARGTDAREEINMLWTIFVVLLVLWALGMVSSYTIGGFIHILLVIAIAVVLIRIIQGQRPV